LEHNIDSRASEDSTHLSIRSAKWKWYVWR